MTATLKILRDEHAALASVLRSMPLLVAATRDGGLWPWLSGGG